MGGDGGVIAAKREYMQSCGDVLGTKGDGKKPLNRTETAELRTKVCAISNQVLREPVAACELGYLYNKDVLISALLERNLNDAFSHIRGLKDIVECRFTLNPAFEKEDAPLDGPKPSRYMCPVTLQELNGSHSFVVLKSTGWILAGKAIKEVGIDSLQEEYGPFSGNDIIHLAPTDEEREGLRKELLAKRELARQAKHAKKLSKKNARRDRASTTTASSSSTPANRTSDKKTNGDHVKGDGDESGHVSGEQRKGKRRKRDRGESATSGAGGALSVAGADSSRVAGAAAQAVEANKQSSAVYASLFGKKNVSNEHLFIATAGHRYNLG